MRRHEPRGVLGTRLVLLTIPKPTIKMVLAQPENKHVTKAFDLSDKTAAVTGTPFFPGLQRGIDRNRRCPRDRARGI